MRFFWARDYSDYHPEEPGGSAAGRTCECRPFDTSILGDYRTRLRPGVMEASVPMPTTGADYRWMNLVARVPRKGIPTFAKRLAQGVGGLVLGRRYAAGGQGLAAGLFAGVLRAGIPMWTDTALLAPGRRRRPRHAARSCDHGGREVTITARRGVVLAAGGFDHNMDMRWKFQSEALGANLSLGAETNTGDAIRLGSGGRRGTSTSWTRHGGSPRSLRCPAGARGDAGRTVAARLAHRRPGRPPIRQRVGGLHVVRSARARAGTLGQAGRSRCGSSSTSSTATAMSLRAELFPRMRDSAVVVRRRASPCRRDDTGRTGADRSKFPLRSSSRRSRASTETPHAGDRSRLPPWSQRLRPLLRRPDDHAEPQSARR